MKTKLNSYILAILAYKIHKYMRKLWIFKV